LRIALFGGTFDPPHSGHLAIAKAAADTFHLDSVLFAPAGRQPLKLDGNPAPFADRLAMTTLACAEAEDERFQPSTVDAPRADGLPNYTVDTLAELRRNAPDAVLFNLVGADSFLDLPRWHQPDQLLEIAEWIVVSRPGFAIENLEFLHVYQRSRVHLLETVHEDVSATLLRLRLNAGDLCSDVLPAPVAEYIQIHQLYR
jgi:nicotinate-nucleotide adenylyltransferase